jgi:hypothetical protein
MSPGEAHFLSPENYFHALLIFSSRSRFNQWRQQLKEENIMKSRFTTTRVALALLATAALTVSLAMGTVSVSAADKKGDLHILKECSEYNGLPGGFCTIASSDLALIPRGTRVYYDQAPGVPAGLLDSNVVLDAGPGNLAFGRCTVYLQNFSGLCTFSDGIGQFAGFQARIDVSWPGGDTYRWDGTFSIDHERDRR